MQCGYIAAIGRAADQAKRFSVLGSEERVLAGATATGASNAAAQVGGVVRAMRPLPRWA
jgi:hypothetical protein